MLYTEESVRANIRNREGKRVFFLGSHDRLTPGARDYLSREHIEIRSGEEAKIEEYRLLGGGILREKPEHMTHLNGDILVMKTHPRIAFRGSIDTLEAELLLCQAQCDGQLRQNLGQILGLTRRLIRCDVLEEPVPEEPLCGLTQEALRKRSHFPADYYGQPHFMPECTDSMDILLLNRCRCAAREAELAGCRAFLDEEGKPRRPDILKALNRISSMLYLLMIQCKANR